MVVEEEAEEGLLPEGQQRSQQAQEGEGEEEVEAVAEHWVGAVILK